MYLRPPTVVGSDKLFLNSGGETEQSLNKQVKWAASPYLLWMAIFIIVPLALIAVFAFTTTVTEDADGNILTPEEIWAIKEEYADRVHHGTYSRS